MKNLFALCLVMSAATASNSFAMSAQMEMEVQAIQSTPCLDTITEVLHSITHPGILTSLNPITGPVAYLTAVTVREAVLYNLDGYEAVVKDIQNNLRKNVSNKAYYTAIAAHLSEHSTETVFGIEVGKTIVSCVRPLLNFKGNVAQQKATAIAARQRIEAIRKAVQ